MKTATSRTKRFVNIEGVHWDVRVVFEGGCYGLNDCLTHNSSDPLVEFHDATGMESQEVRRNGNQFVSRYHASVLNEGDSKVGLNLYGGFPRWQIDAESMVKIMEWVNSLEGGK